MLTRAEKLTAEKARDLGMIAELVTTPEDLIPAAIRQLDALQGKPYKITDAPVNVADFSAANGKAVTGQVLSGEIIAIIEKAVADAAQATSLAAALEVGYQAFGDSACTAAAKEGISAFSERRKPDFEKTG